MENPLISLIIPIYNGEPYVQRLITAIKAQTYGNLEVLLINDGSTDNTVEQCEKYIGGDKRFIIFTKENGGVSSARNYGLQKAQGEFIAFIDADDYIYPEYIEYLYFLLIKHQASMSCCGYYKMWDTEKVRKFDNTSEEITFNSTEALEDLLYRKKITGYPVLKLYNAAMLNSIHFPENVIYGEDMLFTLEAIKHCRKVVYGSKILYIYYQHMASATHRSNNVEQYEVTWKLQYKEIMEYVNQKNPKLIYAAQAKLFIVALGQLCRIWNEAEAENFRKELLKYMKLVDSAVLRDRKCKKMNRVLAFFSCISAVMTVKLCRVYIWLKQALGFETRQSV